MDEDGVVYESEMLKCELCNEYETKSQSMMTSHKAWSRQHGECKKKIFCQ
jgi:hypothetical protein